jgi:hypothetical protein
MKKNYLITCLFALTLVMLSDTVFGVTDGTATFSSAVGTVSCENPNYDCYDMLPMYGDYPEAVASKASRGKCTGTLIAPRIVLTAAHCFEHIEKKKVYYDNSGIFHVYEKDYTIPDGYNNTEYLKNRISIRGEVLIHPNYQFERHDSRKYDIALIILDEPAPIPPWPISLSETLPDEGDELTMFGYGWTGINCKDASQGLRMLKLQITEIIESLQNIVTEDKLNECTDPPEFNTCLKQTTLFGGCKGDSGGPARNSNNEIIGIYTRGGEKSKVINGEKFFTSHSSTFVSIAAHRQWILRYVSTALLNKKSKDCLDVAWSSSPQDGDNVQQWKCHTEGNNQLYYFHYNWDDTFFIRSIYSNMCLGIEEGNDGDWASIKQQQCNGDRRQAWKMVSDEDGWFKIVSAHSNKCMDVKYAALNNGADIIQFECHDGPNMWWRETFPVRIKLNVLSHFGKCMEVGGWRTNEGANINQWDCSINSVNQNNQVWGLEAFDHQGVCLPGDWCSIRSLHSGMCATAESYDFRYANLGINLTQHSCGNYSDNEAQSWYLFPGLVSGYDSGIYQIINGSQNLIYKNQDELCINASSSDIYYEGDNINVSSCNNFKNEENQRWEIEFPVF